MRGGRASFDGLIAAAPSELQMRLRDLLDSVVFKDELTHMIVVVEIDGVDTEMTISAVLTDHEERLVDHEDRITVLEP